MKPTALALGLFALTLSACDEKKTPAPAPAAPAAAAPAAPANPTPTAAAAPAADEPAPLPVGTKTKCPVTGEDFTVKEKTVQVVHAGKRYAFCCAECQPEFDKDPAKYAAK